MARKTKRTKRGNDAVALRATLERFVHEGRRQLQLEELRGLEHLYSHSGNPLAAWHAWRLCRKHDLSPPSWLLAYLDNAADKLIGIELVEGKKLIKQYADPKTKQKLLKVRGVKSVAPDVARVLGFTRRRMRLNQYDRFTRELRELYVFIEIRNYLAEHGRRYGALKPLFEHYAKEYGTTPRAIRDRFHHWLGRYAGRHIGAAPFLLD